MLGPVQHVQYSLESFVIFLETILCINEPCSGVAFSATKRLQKRMDAWLRKSRPYPQASQSFQAPRRAIAGVARFPFIRSGSPGPATSDLAP